VNSEIPDRPTETSQHGLFLPTKNMVLQSLTVVEYLRLKKGEGKVLFGCYFGEARIYVVRVEH